MKIIRATEPIPVEHPVFMLFGQPGIGKSSLGYSCEEPLGLDFDKGAHRAANRRDTLQIDKWADVVELTSSAEALAAYKTIVPDTVGRCLDLMMVDIIRENAKMGRDGNLTQQGWGVLKTRFRAWIQTLRALGKDVLLIAHDKEEKDGDVRIVRPDIVGGSYGEVMKVADFVGYLSIVGRERVLDFNPTDRYIGKNPAGWAPFVLPSASKSQAFMADLMVRGRLALGNISEASAKIAQQVADYRLKIESFLTAEAFNAAIPEIKATSLIVQPQLVKLLMDAAKFRGVPFDKDRKVFVAPAVVAPAVTQSELPPLVAEGEPPTADDIFGRAAAAV